MADYNIYIKNEAAQGGNVSKTKPRKAGSSQRVSKTKAFTRNSRSKFQNALDVAQNPDSLVSKGIGAVAKAVPAIAIAYAVVKVADKVVSTMSEINTIRTGDYSFQFKYNNAKTTLKNILQPFSSSLNAYIYTEKMRVDNERRALNRELLGDSILNENTGRGV